MPKARLENFRLSKDQVKFMKQYKETSKIHKALSTEFKRTLTEADMLRQSLTEVETNMNALVETAKGFRFDKLEGQEDIRAEATRTTMVDNQRPAQAVPGMEVR